MTESKLVKVKVLEAGDGTRMVVGAARRFVSEGETLEVRQDVADEQLRLGTVELAGGKAAAKSKDGGKDAADA